MMVLQEILVSLVPEVLLVPEEQLEHLDPQDLRDYEDKRELQVPMEQVVVMGTMDHQVLTEYLEHQDHL